MKQVCIWACEQGQMINTGFNLRFVVIARPKWYCLGKYFLRTTGLPLGHEYPYFEEQFSQANKQRTIFLLNYHNISHKMNKLLNFGYQGEFQVAVMMNDTRTTK